MKIEKSEYKRTLTQSTLDISYDMELTNPMVLDTVDDWLESVLDIELDDLENITTETDASLYITAEGVSWRVLLLLRALMQASHLPYFDLGTVVHIKKNLNDTTKWHSTIRMVKLDSLHKNIYISMIKFSLEVILWMKKEKKTPKSIEHLYHKISNSVLQPLIRMVGAGKSTMPILNSAYQENIPFIPLSNSAYQLGWGSNARHIKLSGIDHDSIIGAEISNNKIHSAQLCRMAGLPAPEHGVASSEKDAISIAHAIGWPIVVKPSDTDRGEGVSIGIMNDHDLLIAFNKAQDLTKTKQVIIEREVEGVCHRLVIFNGKLLYAVKRLAKSVKGDGKLSVSELILQENSYMQSKPPWKRDTQYPKDELARMALEKAGFTFDSVPNDGEFAPLRLIESTADGGESVDVTESVHSDNLDIALRTSQLFGLHVAGIDIITTDISIPWHVNKAIINEINFRPLLGGNEISKKYIGTFIKTLMMGDGRIPIEVIIGSDKAMHMAREKQKSCLKKGQNCFVTSHISTLSDNTQEDMVLSVNGLFKRCQALLLDKRVDIIIVVVQTDELMYTGLPFDQITSLETIDNTITSHTSTDKSVSVTGLEAILKGMLTTE